MFILSGFFGAVYILLHPFMSSGPRKWFKLGWGHVDGVLGINIPREFSWNDVPKVKEAVYVGFEDEIPEDEVDILDRVYYLNGRPVYTLAKLKQ